MVQTNQTTGRFRLFQQMSHGGQRFSEWNLKIKKEAERCAWTKYDAKVAARDAILYQADDTNLMKKIISKDLSSDDRVKYGQVMEKVLYQGKKKIVLQHQKNKGDH